MMFSSYLFFHVESHKCVFLRDKSNICTLIPYEREDYRSSLELSMVRGPYNFSNSRNILADLYRMVCVMDLTRTESI